MNFRLFSNPSLDLAWAQGLASNPQIVSILGNSIFPSIHGHERIKEVLTLQQCSVGKSGYV